MTTALDQLAATRDLRSFAAANGWRYDETAADLAWSRTVAFLKSALA